MINHLAVLDGNLVGKTIKSLNKNAYSEKKDREFDITLADNEERTIDAIDLVLLVNELRAAGAEAISINSERVIYKTEIVDISTKYILVNGVRIEGPYTIKAVGDKKYLESSISIKNGYIDEMKADNKSISCEVSDAILIPKYNHSVEFDYAKNVEK